MRQLLMHKTAGAISPSCVFLHPSYNPELCDIWKRVAAEKSCANGVVPDGMIDVVALRLPTQLFRIAPLNFALHFNVDIVFPSVKCYEPALNLDVNGFWY